MTAEEAAGTTQTYGPRLPTVDVDEARFRDDALAGGGNVVLTGIFDDPRAPCFAVRDNPLREGRDHVERLVVRAGGTLGKSVSKVSGRTKLVVAGHSPSAKKVQLARNKGVPVINARALADLLAGAEWPPPEANLHGVQYSMGFQPRGARVRAA